MDTVFEDTIEEVLDSFPTLLKERADRISFVVLDRLVDNEGLWQMYQKWKFLFGAYLEATDTVFLVAEDIYRFNDGDSDRVRSHLIDILYHEIGHAFGIDHKGMVGWDNCYDYANSKSRYKDW